MNDDEICNLCGLPKSLCVCDNLGADEQEIVISNGRRKWGKVVTLISFSKNTDRNLEDMLSKAKRKVGAGGTIRGKSRIELQGDHRFRMKKFLTDMGYDADQITIR
ncbi:MAG: stress response translation initiation inhibitor YciH [Candidatus Lokiarchaeota archaeon]|nr:stress response translation initiation inhibitor YciH [Candidatus Lokiarchaeota archaeon]MBD3202244.1 stress response translation initiation inhibitor YciH [Candidatus Lokiarchaeota archaeon]